MKLTIRFFQCWDNFSLETEDGKIVWISGPSGIGKSTIFQAIAWVLYGQIRSISPKNNEKAKTYVCLEIGNMKIERYRQPARLVLTIDKSTHEDDEAQAQINSRFGSYDVWLASCYMQQDSQNAFLMNTNTGKMELLNSMAFNDENPSEIIDKIEDELQVETVAYDHAHKIYQEKVNSFKAKLDALDKTTKRTPEKVQELQVELDNLVDKLKDLKEQTIRRKPVIELHQKLTLQIQKLERQIIEPVEEVDLVYGSKDEARELLDRLKAKQKLEQQLKINKPSKTVTREWATEDYTTTLQQEQRYKNNKKLADKLELEYTENVVKEQIQSWEEVLTESEIWILEEQKEQLETKLAKLKLRPVVELVEPDAFDDQQIIDINEKITDLKHKRKHLEQGLEAMQCPGCNQALLVSGDELVVYDGNTDHINEQIQIVDKELNDYEKQLTQLKKAKKESDQKHREYNEAVSKRAGIEAYNTQIKVQQADLQQEIEKIEKELSTKDKQGYDKLDKSSLELVKSALLTAKSIEFHSLPEVASNVIKEELDLMNKQHVYQKLLEEYKQFEDVDGDVKVVEKYIRLLEQYEKDMIRFEQQTQSREKELERLNKSLNELVITEDCSHEIETSEARIDEIKTEISNAQYYNEVAKEQQQLKVEREKIVEMSDVVAKLTDLLSLSRETESQSLDLTIGAINSTLQYVCNKLFDDGISVSLSAFKVNKINRNIKPSVTLNILYQGASYGYQEMSGGQKRRISIATTIALSKMSGCPFYAMDESLDNMSLEVRELVYELLREQNKTVFITSHNETTGNFDQIIEL